MLCAILLYFPVHLSSRAIFASTTNEESSSALISQSGSLLYFFSTTTLPSQSLFRRSGPISKHSEAFFEPQAVLSLLAKLFQPASGSSAESSGCSLHCSGVYVRGSRRGGSVKEVQKTDQTDVQKRLAS